MKVKKYPEGKREDLQWVCFCEKCGQYFLGNKNDKNYGGNKG